jgi:hypothetical protein
VIFSGPDLNVAKAIFLLPLVRQLKLTAMGWLSGHQQAFIQQLKLAARGWQ